MTLKLTQEHHDRFNTEHQSRGQQEVQERITWPWTPVELTSQWCPVRLDNVDSRDGNFKKCGFFKSLRCLRRTETRHVWRNKTQVKMLQRFPLTPSHRLFSLRSFRVQQKYRPNRSSPSALTSRARGDVVVVVPKVNRESYPVVDVRIQRHSRFGWSIQRRGLRALGAFLVLGPRMAATSASEAADAVFEIRPGLHGLAGPYPKPGCDACWWKTGC